MIPTVAHDSCGPPARKQEARRWLHLFTLALASSIKVDGNTGITLFNQKLGKSQEAIWKETHEREGALSESHNLERQQMKSWRRASGKNFKGANPNVNAIKRRGASSRR